MSIEITHEEALAHFGVKGMHWGQHKTQPSGSGGSSGSAPKPTRNEILIARQRRANLSRQSFDIGHKLNQATTEKGRLAAARELQKNNDEWDKANAIAKRKTGAEKVLTTLAWAGAVVMTARAIRGMSAARGNGF